MKNKIIFVVLAIIAIFTLTGCNEENIEGTKVNNEYQSGREVTGTFQIRFKDLVEISKLKSYNNKTVTAVGYLSPIMSYDGSFGYLMNLPYQTCPYCMPDDTRITNTLAVFAPEGKSLDYTEAAVVVTGTLKLEDYIDDYGYQYSYRLVDAKIEPADTETVGEKIAIYNLIADKNILANIMDAMYAVDYDVFYEDYIRSGYNVKIEKVNVSGVEQAIKDLDELNNDGLKLLSDVAHDTKEIINSVNTSIDNQDYTAMKTHQTKLDNCFNNINQWMCEYEL